MENDSKAGGAGVAVALLIMVAVAAGGGFTGKYLEADEPVARLVHLGALAPDYEME
jgi:multisubunit Na+/H+ antiporter MnhB subunit